jgi:hypothetical protein
VIVDADALKGRSVPTDRARVRKKKMGRRNERADIDGSGLT